MLLIANTSSTHNRTTLLGLLSTEMVPTRLELKNAQIKLDMLRWRDYWKPATPFFECDTRLIQRLNRLKRTWERLIVSPVRPDRQRQFAWRYFGLLHHTLRIARAEPERPAPLAALERLVAFETFTCEAAESEGVCAATATQRNPLWVLASISRSSPLPSPRRVPLLRPIGGDVHAVGERTRVLPVRRFNPAALTTRNGKSVLSQLLRVAKVVFIDDMDLSEADLHQHKQRFGLSDTTAITVEGDGHRTESKSFVIARSSAFKDIQIGRRLW